jgi:hypothetical protein
MIPRRRREKPEVRATAAFELLGLVCVNIGQIRRLGLDRIDTQLHSSNHLRLGLSAQQARESYIFTALTSPRLILEFARFASSI